MKFCLISELEKKNVKLFWADITGKNGKEGIIIAIVFIITVFIIIALIGVMLFCFSV